MAYQPCPLCIEVVLEGTIWGEQYVNTFYFLSLNDPVSLAAMEDLTAALAGGAETNLCPQLPDSVELVRVIATDLSEQFGLQSITLIPPGTVGEQVSTMPGSVCMSIKRTTSSIGRSRRGRVYWPLWDAAISDTDGNLSSPTIAANVIGAIEDWIALHDPGEFQPVILSRQEGGVVRPEGVTFPLTGWSVADFNVDSQRRRLKGRGA